MEGTEATEESDALAVSLFTPALAVCLCLIISPTETCAEPARTGGGSGGGGGGGGGATSGVEVKAGVGKREEHGVEGSIRPGLSAERDKKGLTNAIKIIIILNLSNINQWVALLPDSKKKLSLTKLCQKY